MLRENQRLRENQDLLLQENQFLRDRWEPHRARFAVQDGGGAPMMAVAPGVWADPVVAPVVAMAVARGACAVPVAPGAWAPVDACATQLADVPPDVAPRAARPCKRGGAAQRAPAQCEGTRAALPARSTASPTGSCFPEPTQAPRGPRVRNKPPGDPEAPHCQEPSHLVARLVAWSQQRPEQRRAGARAGRGQPSGCA